MTKAEIEQEDIDRLQVLEDFERLKFYPWLQWMASAASLSVENILTVLSHAVTNPLIIGLKVSEDPHSFTYRKWNRFLGHTPLETACLMFVADHWKAGKPIPSRDITWNNEWGGQRVDVFRSTTVYISLPSNLTRHT